MNLSFALFVVVGFVAVVLLIEGLFVYWNDTKSPEVRRVSERLRAISAGGHSDATELKLLKQRGVELPLILSDHSDWDELTQTIRDTGAGEVWVTHGREEALVHYATGRGIRARALALIGFEDEDSEEGAS